MKSYHYLLTILCIITILTTTIYAQPTEVAPQCQTPPTLIPDTFSISYQPIDSKQGVVYYTYIEPSWENWPMFDIRELASDPFQATFIVNITASKLKFEQPNCAFRTSQSFSRPNAVTPIFSTDGTATILTLTFTQTGTYYCHATPTVTVDTRGQQQHSIEGSLTALSYVCNADGQPTSQSTPILLDAASKVSLPDLYVNQPCSRLTLTYNSTSQLTLRQTNGLALDISALKTMIPSSSIPPQTVLHSYSLTKAVDTKQINGYDVYTNVLSFCTFNGELSSEFKIDDLFVPGTDTSQVLYSIKSSKIPSYCFNGIKDFDESDVDCGGNGQLNGCPPCVDSSQICNGNSDCVSGQCVAHEIAGKRCLAINNTKQYIYSLFSISIVIIATIILF